MKFQIFIDILNILLIQLLWYINICVFSSNPSLLCCHLFDCLSFQSLYGFILTIHTFNRGIIFLSISIPVWIYFNSSLFNRIIIVFSSQSLYGLILISSPWTTSRSASPSQSLYGLILTMEARWKRQTILYFNPYMDLF